MLAITITIVTLILSVVLFTRETYRIICAGNNNTRPPSSLPSPSRSRSLSLPPHCCCSTSISSMTSTPSLSFSSSPLSSPSYTALQSTPSLSLSSSPSLPSSSPRTPSTYHFLSPFRLPSPEASREAFPTSRDDEAEEGSPMSTEEEISARLWQLDLELAEERGDFIRVPRLW